MRIYVRWNHQCGYNDMNYHIASRGLFHGGHVGFTPSWTQRTDKIRLPSYSPYQKTYVDIKVAFPRYFFREAMKNCSALFNMGRIGNFVIFKPNFDNVLGFILLVCHKAHLD